MFHIRPIRGAVQYEYVILVTATMIIALDGVALLGRDIRAGYNSFRGELAAHTADAAARGALRDAPGMPETPAPFHPETPDCAPYEDFDASFLDTRINTAIVVPGNWLGRFDENTLIFGKSTTIGDITPMGSADHRFIVGKEGSGRHISTGDRISVHGLDGSRKIDRALIRIDGPDDPRAGDEYIISHTGGLILDLHGFPAGSSARDYAANTGRSGAPGFGDNDGSLDIRDTECEITVNTPETESCPDGTGNPGNHKCVGNAGENPDGSDGFGDGDKGKSDGNPDGPPDHDGDDQDGNDQDSNDQDSNDQDSNDQDGGRSPGHHGSGGSGSDHAGDGDTDGDDDSPGSHGSGPPDHDNSDGDQDSGPSDHDGDDQDGHDGDDQDSGGSPGHHGSGGSGSDHAGDDDADGDDD